MKEFLFKALVSVIYVIVKVLFPFKAKGRENIPDQGGIILCSNHISLLDPVFIILTSKRRVYFMAKNELFKNRILAAFFRFCGAFPVDRGKNDSSAIDNAKQLVVDGKVFGIFVEGTRTKNPDASPGKPKSGAAVVAASTDSDILPVAVTYKHGRPRLFSRAVVNYGKVIKAEEIKINEIKTSEIKKVKTRIMDEITSLWEAETKCLK